MLPTDLAEVVAWRLAESDEIPRGATTVANAARKAGWNNVRIGFARMSWVTADGDDEPDTSEDAKTSLVEMISVQGRRGGRAFRANWHRKLWTKDGANGDYKFAGAQMWPAIEGEVIATKAKKDRHPEHLGDKTIGGLKNSKTLNDYLKQGDDSVAEKEK
jgi:hypothetical protein